MTPAPALTGLFGRAWPRFCAGYVADAIGREAKRWHRLAPAPLSALTQGQAERAPVVGLREEYRPSVPGPASATVLMAFPLSKRRRLRRSQS